MRRSISESADRVCPESRIRLERAIALEYALEGLTVQDYVSSEELVKYLKETGVVASLGHTAAGYNDVEKAVKSGATNVTHTYNAQKAYHHRDIGTVGAALLLDELNCEIICDTIMKNAQR